MLQRKVLETIIDHIQLENGNIADMIAYLQRTEELYGSDIKLKNPNGPTHLCVVTEELEPEVDYQQRVKEYIAEYLVDVDLEALYAALKEVLKDQ